MQLLYSQLSEIETSLFICKENSENQLGGGDSFAESLSLDSPPKEELSASDWVQKIKSGEGPSPAPGKGGLDALAKKWGMETKALSLRTRKLAMQVRAGKTRLEKPMEKPFAVPVNFGTLPDLKQPLDATALGIPAIPSEVFEEKQPLVVSQNFSVKPLDAPEIPSVESPFKKTA